MVKTQLSMFDNVEDQAANVQEQVLNASATGGVTEQADDPTQDRLQIANILTPILKAASEMSGAATKVSEDIAGRVPTQIETRLTTGVDEQATKDYWAKELLSPERYEEFKARGFSATNADEEQVLKKARETLTNDQAMEGIPLSEDMLSKTVGEDKILVKENKRTKKGKVIIGEDLDFNFNNIKTDDDIKRVIQATSQIYRKQTDAAVGAAKTLDETKEDANQLLADELGITKKALQKNRGLLDAAESTALRSLLVNSAKKIDDLAKRISGDFVDENGVRLRADKSTETMFQFRRQMALHAGLQIAAKKQQTQLARALSSYRIDVGTDIKLETKLMDDVIKSGGGYTETEKLAKGVQKAIKEGGSAGLNTFVDKATAYGNAAYEIYINGLLSGPKTFFKNALGTPLWMSYLLIEDSVAAIYGSLERGGKKLFKKELTAKDAEGVYLSQLGARLYGYIHAFRDAAANSVETLKTESSAAAVGRVDTARFRAIDSETLGASGVFGAAIDFFGRITRIPGLALQSTDDFWKGIAQRATLYEMAVNKAAQSKYLGKNPEEAAQDGIEVLLDPNSISDEIDYAANFATLTNDTGIFGKISRGIQQLPFGRLLMPFATVPTNSVKNVVSRSLLQAINPNVYKDLTVRGTKARSKAVAKIATASSMFMYVAHLASQGRVTGAMPRDKKERAMLAPGWQPHSFVFRGEGFPKDKSLYDDYGNPNGPLVYVSYAGLEPVGLLFALGANFVESARRSRDLNFVNSKAERYVYGMLDYIQEMPMIHTFGTISKAFQEQDVSVLYNSPLSNFFGFIPKPYSSLQRNIKRLNNNEITKASEQFDLWTEQDVLEDAEKNNRYGADGEPYYENIGLKKSIALGILDLDKTSLKEISQRAITAQVGDKDREAKQYDVFGNVKTKGVSFSTNPVLALWNMIFPFSISFGEAFTPLQEEIVRLRVPLSLERTTIKDIPLNRMQRSEWTDYAKNKQILRIKGKSANFNEALDNLFNSRSYSRMTDNERKAAFRRIEKKFYDAAAEEFLIPSYPEILEAIESRQFYLGGN